MYAHLDRLEPMLAAAGMPLRRVSAGNVRADALGPGHRFASVPYYTQRRPGPCRRCPSTGSRDGAACVRCRGTGWDDGRGIARRQCTGEYEVKPIKARSAGCSAGSPSRRRRGPGRAAARGGASRR